MAESKIIIALAKVLVAEAWVDGEVSAEEINSLKDLLFHVPAMTAHDWAEIDIYIDSPVEDAERARLLEDFTARLSSPADRELALQMVDQIIQADGKVGASEREVAEELKRAILGSHAGLSGSFSRLVRGSARKRSQAVAQAPGREAHLDDFVKNKVYYKVAQRIESENPAFAIPEGQLRKLSLAGGLMARIAIVDQQVLDPELQSIQRALQTQWGLPPGEAALVAEVAVSEIGKGLDYFRLSRQFFECTTEDERVRFLDVLFAVTTSDGRASYAEIEEIRTIANGLKLTHQQFIAAKLKVPAELR
jgi:uncharacterized tellurite resistance protein B-like protein